MGKEHKKQTTICWAAFIIFVLRGGILMALMLLSRVCVCARARARISIFIPICFGLCCPRRDPSQARDRGRNRGVDRKKKEREGKGSEGSEDLRYGGQLNA